jgi:acid phosphatase type 7
MDNRIPNVRPPRLVTSWRLPALLLGAALACSAMLPQAAAAESRVTLEPAAGPGGTRAALRGLGFGAADPVVVKLGRRTLARTRTGGRGRFSASIRIPSRRRGPLKILTRSRSRRVVNIFFASPVTGAPAVTEIASRTGKRFRLSPGRGSVGSTVRLRGSRLPPGRRIRITLGGTRVATGTTKRRGGFSSRFTVPPLSIGRHLLRAKVGSSALGLRFSVARDPLVATAGDIACDPDGPNFNGGNGTPEFCHMRQTSDLVLSAKPDLVLALGDTQYEAGSFEDHRASYHPTWGRFKAITRPAVGNHEYGTAKASGYFDYFNGVGNQTGPAGQRGKGYYSFDVGAWHLIAINSNCTEIGITCGLGSPQEQWLRADLAAHSNRCTLAYWHHPLFSSGQGGNHPTMHDMFRALYEAKADLVLTGHDHYYERFAPQTHDGVVDPVNGIRQFIVGTGGRDLQRTKKPIKNNSEVRHFETYGVLSLTLHPGSYDWKFLPESGRTFSDSGTQSCH